MHEWVGKENREWEFTLEWWEESLGEGEVNS